MNWSFQSTCILLVADLPTMIGHQNFFSKGKLQFFSGPSESLTKYQIVPSIQ